MDTHTKFGLKSLAVRIALVPVALMFGISLVDSLSTIVLPGMPWNNPTIASLGRVCHPLYDSGKTQTLCNFAVVGDMGCLFHLFVKPGSYCITQALLELGIFLHYLFECGKYELYVLG